MSASDQWIFYLKLNRDLPREYVALDQSFKVHGKSLVPVGIKGLLDMASKNTSVHIVLYVKTFADLDYFNRRVKRILKYLMRNHMVNLYIASSFGAVNDGTLLKREQFNFAKLPVRMNTFCESVSSMMDLKESEYFKWPGGKRPKMSLAG